MSETQHGSNLGSQSASDSRGASSSVRQQAADIAGDIKSQAAGVAQDVTKQVKEQAAQLSDKARNAATDAGGKLLDAAEDQKNAGADFVSGLAGAVRRAAGEFETQIPQAKDYFFLAADQIDNASDALRQRDLREILDGIQGFARRQPTAFLGITVLAGFAAVRFLRSGTSSPSWATEEGNPSPHASSENARRLQGAGSGMPQGQRM